MILFIDSADKQNLLCAIIDQSGMIVVKKNIKAQFSQAEKILPLITKILEKAKVSFRDISRILVVKGPGPFTALRVGIVTANALAYSLKIPIVGILKENVAQIAKDVVNLNLASGQKIIIPEYGQEPNITKPKMHGKQQKNNSYSRRRS